MTIRCGVKEGSARPAANSVASACAGLALLLLASPALAGDNAAINFIGYSDDGRYFAFEQYGIQDASAFPYSDIFIVDTEVAGAIDTPLSHRIATEETQSLLSLRAANLDAVKGELAKDEIDKNIVVVAALNGDGKGGTAARALDFGLPHYAGPEDKRRYRLALTIDPFNATQKCEDLFGRKGAGFTLRLTADHRTSIVHRDKGPSDSRFCSAAYSLYAVVLPYGDDGLHHAVAIVSTYAPMDFETLDRRFIAVPLDGN